MALVVRNAVKGYRGRTVLDIPYLRLEPGTRCGILGANGAGKTTLLRLLAGTLTPDSGTLAWEGAALRCGYLPQKPYAFGTTVLHNVMLGLEGSKTERRSRALEALTQVGLERLALARGNTLSGGEQQRMALARLLARSWPMLLLDEPTSAADLAGAELAEKALLAQPACQSGLLVFTTHNPAQACRLANHLILLHQGRIAEQGKPEEVLFRPKSLEAQRFLAHIL
ncbi:MAG: ABC transporter ATP-binding protein [Oscillospiraceae bacterium]|nr:ABC transporter ATP-binding protein [Oscillospiraceae bacterium]